MDEGLFRRGRIQKLSFVLVVSGAAAFFTVLVGLAYSSPPSPSSGEILAATILVGALWFVGAGGVKGLLVDRRFQIGPDFFVPRSIPFRWVLARKSVAQKSDVAEIKIYEIEGSKFALVRLKDGERLMVSQKRGVPARAFEVLSGWASQLDSRHDR